MYKLFPDHSHFGKAKSIKRITDNACIPFDPANTDYANFKKQILADEAQLQNADENVMTNEEAKTYVRGLP